MRTLENLENKPVQHMYGNRQQAPHLIKLNNNKNQYIKTTNRLHRHNVNSVIKGAQTKHPISYIQTPIFLDTETSHNHNEDAPIAWIYQWALEWQGEYLVGRDIVELIEALKWIVKEYKLDDIHRAVIYIHNLSYDYTYLADWLYEAFGQGEILAIKSRKILTVVHGGLEFRCSYLLSNMSLAQWGKKLECDITKMSGAIDYQEIRYPDSPLTLIDWEYMINDVAALKECVYRSMVNDNDTLATIPLTSTGYVRRDVRRAARKDKTYWKWFRKCKLSVRAYQLSKLAFAGGLTHGNRFLGGKIINGVGHVDYKSHYPAREQLNYTPVEDFKLFYSKSQDNGEVDQKEINKLLDTHCCLVHIVFNNLRLKKGVTLPCLSKSKVQNFYECDFINDLGARGTDNGKVIDCLGRAAVVCTEIDLKWIFKQYDNDGWEIIELYIAKRGRVRESTRKVIDDYFIIKESEESGVYRDKIKNKLNGIYGMFATDPIRPDITYNYDTHEWSESRDIPPEYIQEKIDKYYSNRNNFTYYPQGVYTTAHARDCLLYVVSEVIGYDNYIYSDTDSVFYIKSPEVEKRIAQYNEEIIQANKELGLGVVNRKGTISYYGVLDHEEDCTTFKFLHAKCYGYTNKSGKLNLTIAGVTKDNKLPKDSPEYITREQELGSLEALADGFIFKECGGTRAKYISGECTEANINGHMVHYASACIILNTTKELGGTVDGWELMEVE